MGLTTALPREFYLSKPATPVGEKPDGLATARLLGWMAQLAYEASYPGKPADILAAWGWSPPMMLESTGHVPATNGFVTTQGNVAVLAFAGTEPTSIPNWITGFTAHLNSFGQHSGFAEGVDLVWDQIRPAIEQLAPGTRLLVTGHSLGASLAALAALRLTQEEPASIVAVDCFGMPRVGDAGFAALYAASGLAVCTTRYTYGQDMVPATPPADPPFNYRHVGAVLHADAGHVFEAGKRVASPQDGPNPLAQMRAMMQSLMEQEPAGMPRYPRDDMVGQAMDHLPAPIRDHLPDRYLYALGVLPG